MRYLCYVCAAAMVAGQVWSDDHGEELASDDEVAKIAAEIAKFNCDVPDEVEKESETLFELDDAVCEAGQYDIKLDERFKVMVMSYDGPVDD